MSAQGRLPQRRLVIAVTRSATCWAVQASWTTMSGVRLSTFGYDSQVLVPFDEVPQDAALSDVLDHASDVFRDRSLGASPAP